MLLALLAGFSVGFDDAAESRRIFAASERMLKDASSMSGKLYGAGKGAGTPQTAFLFEKPSSFRRIDGVINQYCDGKVQINHLVQEKQYFRRDVSRRDYVETPIAALDGFFGQKTGKNVYYYVASTTYRMQNVDGRRCAAKAMFFESGGRGDRMVFFVDAASKRPVGWDQVFGHRKMFWRFVGMRFNVPVPEGAFDWKPSPDLTEKPFRRLRHP